MNDETKARNDSVTKIVSQVSSKGVTETLRQLERLLVTTDGVGKAVKKEALNAYAQVYERRPKRSVYSIREWEYGEGDYIWEDNVFLDEDQAVARIIHWIKEIRSAASTARNAYTKLFVSGRASCWRINEHGDIYFGHSTHTIMIDTYRIADLQQES